MLDHTLAEPGLYGGSISTQFAGNHTIRQSGCFFLQSS